MLILFITIYVIITSSIGKRLLDLYPHMRDALQKIHIGELDTINENDSRLRLKGTFLLGLDEQLAVSYTHLTLPTIYSV